MTLLHNRFTDEHEKDMVLMSEVTSASGKGEAASAGDRRGCGIIRLKFYVSVDEWWCWVRSGRGDAGWYSLMCTHKTPGCFILFLFFNLRCLIFKHVIGMCITGADKYKGYLLIFRVTTLLLTRMLREELLQAKNYYWSRVGRNLIMSQANNDDTWIKRKQTNKQNRSPTKKPLK